MTDPPEGASPPASVAAVSVKLPPFWPTDPEVWFLQVEAQFSTRNITSQKTRFDHVISSLSPEIATEVRDILLKPPGEQPYDVLKTELIKRTAASEQRKLQQLIGGEELGDRKPTQLLRRMQQLMGDKLGSTPETTSFLRELFLQRLPNNVRMVLASADSSTELSKLAEMADKVLEVATPTTVATITDHRQKSPPRHRHTSGSDIQQLRDEVARLTTLVESLASQSRRYNRSKSRGRSPTPASNTGNTDTTFCWYHRKYGDAARQCRPPCTWTSKDQAGS